jgi:hypothetical protein
MSKRTVNKLPDPNELLIKGNKERHMTDRSIVGDLINFRGLVYAPINENGVIFLFGKIADDLNMYIEEIKPGFPDCIGRRFIGKGWERVSIEFEFKSSNFKQHKHDEKKCDIIICWEHDWRSCPIEVIELKTEIIGLENSPIEKPDSNRLISNMTSLETLFKNVNSNDKVIDWYAKIFEKISKYDSSIWQKIGAKYVGWYSPAKAFVSVKPSTQSIKFECYSGKDTINDTIVTNKRFSPNWCKFSVKSDADIQKIISILIESHKRIKDALLSGKQTGYFSDGEQFGTTMETIDNEEEPEQT